MTKKLLSIALAIFLVPCMFFMTACKKDPPAQAKATSLNISEKAHTAELTSTLQTAKSNANTPAQSASVELMDYDFDNLTDDQKYQMAINYITTINSISQIYEGLMGAVTIIEERIESLGQTNFDLGIISKNGNTYKIKDGWENPTTTEVGYTLIVVNNRSIEVKEYEKTSASTEVYLEEHTKIEFNNAMNSFKIEENDYDEGIPAPTDHEFFEITVLNTSAAIQAWDSEDSLLMQIKYAFASTGASTEITSFTFGCSNNASTAPTSIFNAETIPNNFAEGTGCLNYNWSNAN